MALDWINTEYNDSTATARLAGFEIRVTSLGRANQDGPLRLVSLFDNTNAFESRSWSFHTKTMDEVKERGMALIADFIKEQAARQSQLLAALQDEADGDSAVRCDACGEPCPSHTAIAIANNRLALCRRCTEHLRAGLDGLGPDKTPWRYGPSFIHVFQKGDGTKCGP